MTSVVFLMSAPLDIPIASALLSGAGDRLPKMVMLRQVIRFLRLLVISSCRAVKNEAYLNHLADHRAASFRSSGAKH
jgi:hypothetical protein